MTVTAARDVETPAGALSPDHILQIGMGFWASKTLLSAVELDLFTTLGDAGMAAAEIATRLDLHDRARDDFLDALVSLGLLVREGDGPEAMYRNTPATSTFLDTRSPAYLGGILTMSSKRLYGFWSTLTEALHTGMPQNEIKAGGPTLFDVVYSDPKELELFLSGMSGIQLGAFHALGAAVDFSAFSTFCDIGGADGTLAAILAQAHPHLTGSVLELPPVVPIADALLAREGVSDRVRGCAGDFFTDDFPSADVYLMGNVLHNWDEARKQALIDKAYAGLPSGGILVAIEAVIDDARRVNTFGLLMSLNMMIELPGGFDYTGAQFDTWARTAGFARTEVRHLAGPTSAAIAYKD
jgi:hypothetical protein